jgi:hypothetical protein
VTREPRLHDQEFRLDEATIEELHEAIQAGRTTCVAVVQHYLDRVRAYDGVASLLVTEDGAPTPATNGARRATTTLRFPMETVKASTILPDLHKYKGPPLEFGRLETTASDPEVRQQFGMIVGRPNAGQVNALATLNIRGERSVTCRGDFDRHPSAGPLPPGAPPEYNRRAGNPGGRHAPDKVLPSTLGYQRSTWGGNPANPYDTTRAASLGSSSGSGVSVSTNLVMASLGEETRASCRGPANHNAVALILPHKSMLGFNGGAAFGPLPGPAKGNPRGKGR